VHELTGRHEGGRPQACSSILGFAAANLADAIQLLGAQLVSVDTAVVEVALPADAGLLAAPDSRAVARRPDGARTRGLGGGAGFQVGRADPGRLGRGVLLLLALAPGHQP